MLIASVSSCGAADEELTGAFGISVGLPLPSSYIKETTEYPTQMIALDATDDYLGDAFKSVRIQILSESKEVYSIVAETKFVNEVECLKSFKSLMAKTDKKHGDLKVTREVTVNDKKSSTFDGYLSADKQTKLSLYCGVKPEGVFLGFEFWQLAMTEEAAARWERYKGEQ